MAKRTPPSIDLASLTEGARSLLTANEIVVFQTPVDISLSKTQLSEPSKLMVRYALLQAIGHDNGIIVPNSNTRKYLSSWSLFCQFLATKGVVDVHKEFDFDQVVAFAKFLVDERQQNGLPIYALDTIQKKLALPNQFAALALSGLCVWPTTQQLDRLQAKTFLKKYVAKAYPEIDVHNWSRGGSRETVTLPTAMLMLNYSLEQLSSLEHRVLCAYFTVCRNNAQFDWWVRRGGVLSIMANTLLKYSETENEAFQCPNNTLGYIRGYNRHQFNKQKGYLDQWLELVNEELDTPLTMKALSRVAVRVMATPGMITTQVEHYRNCALGVLCILTGYRVHEIINMKGTVMKKKHGIVYLTTRIDKTHQGLKVTRATGDAVAVAVDSLLEMSYIDKSQPIVWLDENGTEQQDYCSLLFTGVSRPVKENAGQPHANGYLHVRNLWLGYRSREIIHQSDYMKGAVNSWMIKLYDATLQSLPKALRAEIEALNENITVHAFRHCFVDFLLRRFDGELHTFVKRCFAHSSKDVLNYIENYVRNKTSAQVQQAAERRYCEEMIVKIASDKNYAQFSGPVVAYIHSRLDEMHWTTMEELDDLVHEWVEEDLVHLVPHKFGYCMVFKQRAQLAKCRDEKGVPKVTRGASDLCLGQACGNLFIKWDSHSDTLDWLKLTHSAIVKECNDPDNLRALLHGNFGRLLKESTRMIQTIDALDRYRA